MPKQNKKRNSCQGRLRRQQCQSQPLLQTHRTTTRSQLLQCSSSSWKKLLMLLWMDSTQSIKHLLNLSLNPPLTHLHFPRSRQ